MENETTIDDSVSEEDCNNWDDHVILSRRSTELVRAARARVAVARAGEELTRIIKDRSVAIVDCGATDTLTSSLINATDVEEKLTIHRGARLCKLQGKFTRFTQYELFHLF